MVRPGQTTAGTGTSATVALAHGLFGSGDAWPQFHAGGPNAGVALRHTAPPLRPAWRRELGLVTASVPVVDSAGSVYLGTASGALLRVSADGSSLSRRDYGRRIHAPVAVAGDGAVYFLMHEQIDDDDELPLRTTLVKTDATLAPVWTVALPDGFVATGAPKLWEQPDGVDVFVHVADGFSSELLVYSSTGALRARSGAARCTRPIVGEGPFSAIGDFVDWLGDIMWLDVPPPAGIRFPMPSPTPAIVDYNGLIPAGRALIVTIDDLCSIRAFAYDGATLDERWARGFKLDLRHSSPAVIAGGLLVIGDDDGQVLGLDVLTGTELWAYDAGESVLATPSSFVRPIFVVSRTRLHSLELNGTLRETREIEDLSAASPAVSGDFVHVSASNELASFSIASLGDDVRDSDFRGGLLGPAVGPDGTLYAVHDHTELWAYAAP